MARSLAALWLAFSLAGAASAATQSGSLAAAAASGSPFRVTCSDDGAGAPASLAVQVRDDPPAAAALVSVQVRKGSSASSATDPAEGDADPSPLVFVNGGSGVYDVYVDKTAAGVEGYTLGYQCMTGTNGTGVPTGTSISPSAGVPIPVLPFFAALLLALALGGASVASAHTQAGSLGAAASATDSYQVTCSDDGSGAPASLIVQILDASPAAAPLVMVQAQKGTELVNSTDPGDADADPSPEAFVNGGAGVYNVLVDKTGAGAESYTLTYHCYTGPNGTGIHTGTTLTTLQNQ